MEDMSEVPTVVDTASILRVVALLPEDADLDVSYQVLAAVYRANPQSGDTLSDTLIMKNNMQILTSFFVFSLLMCVALYSFLIELK
ncbi:unnamed protein product [Arctia plantaginis]|uniref:Uncharacterized protein n=1 Tax=Arctia plantaginis TaxID=874455 RepID=A0A8S0YWB3_ARCPL|nr:unnamed protein product [Arctia plantaginis]CAB3253713.1 unnamed protein product [Arctia plantaginis]